MKTKALRSLVRGLVVAVAIGTTVLTDTLSRPANAQQEIYRENTYGLFLADDGSYHHTPELIENTSVETDSDG